MKILIVSQYFWPENFRINAIVETLVQRGIDVEILTGKPNYPEGEVFNGYRAWGCQIERWKGATLYRVPLMPRGNNSRLGLVINYLSFVFFGTFAGSWMLRNKSYDLIFVYGLSPILLAIPGVLIGWWKKRRVIIWIQDLWPESLSATGYIHNRYIIGAVRRLVRFIYRQASLLLVQSRAFEPPVRELAPHVPIVYYPNSVDDTFATPSQVELPHIAGLEEGFSVMFAGNIGSAQAVDVIVGAASLLRDYKDIHFIVLGDGSRRAWMHDEVKRRGLINFHLPGRFPVETMPAFMQKASALLVTLADQEIFAVTIPNKVQAYMAAGRPIVASLNGEGARLILEAKAGVVSSAEDANGLAQAILHLHGLSALERAEMGANGRQYYREHFDHELLVGQLIGHFEQVAGN